MQSHYHRGVGAYGLLFSAMAAGMVAGSLIWARWHPRKWRVAICFAAFGINDLGIIVVALSPWYPLAVLAVAWRGLWIGIGIAAWLTLITELVPEHLLSRVMSFDFFGSLGLTPVGFVLAGSRRDDGRADDDPRGRRRPRARSSGSCRSRGAGSEPSTDLDEPAGETWFPPPSIGVRRFELRTSPTRTERATRLRHTPRRPTD